MVFLAFFAFAGILFWAFSTARPLFKQRGELSTPRSPDV